MTGNKFFLSFVAQDDLHFCIVSFIISNKNNSVWLLLTTLLTTLLINLLLCLFKITSILVYYLLHYVYKDICYKLWHVTSLWREQKTRNVLTLFVYSACLLQNDVSVYVTTHISTWHRADCWVVLRRKSGQSATDLCTRDTAATSTATSTCHVTCHGQAPCCERRVDVSADSSSSSTLRHNFMP